MPIIYSASRLKERDSHDHYPTPISHVRAGLSLLPPLFQPEYVLDPGAGTGVWGTVARERFPNAVIVGTDIRPLSRPAAYTFWFAGGYDFLLNRDRGVFDLVMGNPPFGKRGTKNDRRAAEKFVRRGLALLAPHGWLVYLLPLSFLAGQSRGRGLWRDCPPVKVVVSSERPSFTGDGHTDNTEYAFYCWQEGFSGKTTLDVVLASDFAHDTHQLRLLA